MTVDDPRSPSPDRAAAGPGTAPEATAETDASPPPLPPLGPWRHPRLWAGLLIAYLALFVITGGLAFFSPDRGGGAGLGAQLSRIQDADLRATMLQMAQDEEAEHQKRAGLASHSFNVVLGALLGFLSASAAGLNPGGGGKQE